MSSSRKALEVRSPAERLDERPNAELQVAEHQRVAGACPPWRRRAEAANNLAVDEHTRTAPADQSRERSKRLHRQRRAHHQQTIGTPHVQQESPEARWQALAKKHHVRFNDSLLSQVRSNHT